MASRSRNERMIERWRRGERVSSPLRARRATECEFAVRLSPAILTPVIFDRGQLLAHTTFDRSQFG